MTSVTTGHVRHKTKPSRQSYESPSEPVRTAALERESAATTSLTASRLVVACEKEDIRANSLASCGYNGVGVSSDGRRWRNAVI